MHLYRQGTFILHLESPVKSQISAQEWPNTSLLGLTEDSSRYTAKLSRISDPKHLSLSRPPSPASSLTSSFPLYPSTWRRWHALRWPRIVLGYTCCLSVIINSIFPSLSKMFSLNNKLPVKWNGNPTHAVLPPRTISHDDYLSLVQTDRSRKSSLKR